MNFWLVPAVRLAGARLARFRARGMAWAMVAIGAFVLGLTTVARLAAGPAITAPAAGRSLAAVGCFVALFLTAAWLYRRAARAR